MHVSRLLEGVIVALVIALATTSCHSDARAGCDSGPCPIQVVTDISPVRVLGMEEILYRVRSVALTDTMVVVLTDSDPVVHLFGTRSYRAWGARGQGPGEFSAPRSVAVVGDRLLIHNFAPGSSVFGWYSIVGEMLSSTPVYSHTYVTTSKTTGGQVYFEGRLQHEAASEILRLGTSRSEPIITLAEQPEIRIVPDTGPSITVPRPFAPRPLWAMIGDRIAYWDGKDDSVRLLDENGSEVSRLRLPENETAIDKSDREAWLLRRFNPEEELFGQKDLFRGAREKARTELSFPTRFPRALRLKGAPDGELWVLRAEKEDRERWLVLREGRNSIDVTLPPRRSLMEVDARYVATVARDEDGAETVELYEKKDLEGR